MIKRKSWHYWLANFGEPRMWAKKEINFCTYFWYVVFGLFHLLAVIFGILIVTVLETVSFQRFYLFLKYGTVMDVGAAIVVALTLGVGVIVGLIFALSWFEDYRFEKNWNTPEPEPKEPGFFLLTYRKFKDKACFKVKISED